MNTTQIIIRFIVFAVIATACITFTVLYIMKLIHAMSNVITETKKVIKQDIMGIVPEPIPMIYSPNEENEQIEAITEENESNEINNNVV